MLCLNFMDSRNNLEVLHGDPPRALSRSRYQAQGDAEVQRALGLGAQWDSMLGSSASANREGDSPRVSISIIISTGGEGAPGGAGRCAWEGVSERVSVCVCLWWVSARAGAHMCVYVCVRVSVSEALASVVGSPRLRKPLSLRCSALLADCRLLGEETGHARSISSSGPGQVGMYMQSLHASHVCIYAHTHTRTHRHAYMRPCTSVNRLRGTPGDLESKAFVLLRPSVRWRDAAVTAGLPPWQENA